MSRIFKFFGVVATALMLGAFALPASAAKTITLTVPPGPLAAGTQNIAISVNNTGNSNANSFEIDWIPSANFKVNSGTVADGTVGTISTGYGIYGSPYKGIVFLKQLPNKNSVTVTLNVTVSSSCGPTSTTWAGAAWTGAPGPLSQSFSDTGKPYTTTIAAADTGTCTLKFEPQPKGAQVNTTITSIGSNPAGPPVGVAVYNGANVDTSFTGAISLAIKTGTGAAGATLAGGAATNATAGVATFPNLSINTVGTNYQLTATSAGVTSADSDKFSIFSSGNIGCVAGQTATTNNYDSSAGPTDYTYDPDSASTPPGNGWGLRRGKNKDGPCNMLVAYTFTAPTSGNNSVASLLFDQTTGEKASWKYLVTWGATAADANSPTAGWTTFRPWVSWIPDRAPSAQGDWVPALFCLADPGDLTQRTPLELSALLPAMPNDCASPLGPAASDGPFCTAYKANPLVYPLAGTAKMCVSQQGFTSGIDTHNNNAPVLYPWTEFVDEADGYSTPKP